MSFVPKDVLAKLPSMSESEIDGLPYGVVGLTDGGQIVKYSRYQSELANVEKKNAMGKGFFKEIAPCTQNGLFAINFDKGVKSNALDAEFPYTFTYKMKPTNVLVHMYRCTATRTNWVLVKKA
jgi:photoactive yellow protein